MPRMYGFSLMSREAYASYTPAAISSLKAKTRSKGPWPEFRSDFITLSAFWRLKLAYSSATTSPENSALSCSASMKPS